MTDVSQDRQVHWPAAECVLARRHCSDRRGRARRPARLPRRASIRNGSLIGVPVALVVWLALVPLVFLLWQSFLTPQSAAAPARFTLENYRSRLSQRRNARLFFNSLQFAVGAAVLALVVGTGARLDERAHQHAVQDAVLRARRSSRWSSPASCSRWRGSCWRARRSASSISCCRSCSAPTPCSFNIYTMAGMIWVDGLHYSPMAFLLMTAAFRSMDPVARGVGDDERRLGAADRAADHAAAGLAGGVRDRC